MDGYQDSKSAELRAEAERQRIELIKLELKLGFTFASLARTESSLGELAGTQQAINNAMKAHEAVLKFLPLAQFGKEERQEIEGKLKELKQAIEGLNKSA
jgi:hypothetical protein